MTYPQEAYAPLRSTRVSLVGESGGRLCACLPSTSFPFRNRCRANSEQIGQSRPYSFRNVPAPAGRVTVSRRAADDDAKRGDSLWISLRWERMRLLALGCVPVIEFGLTPLEGVPREQKLLKGHLHRIIYHQVY